MMIRAYELRDEDRFWHYGTAWTIDEIELLEPEPATAVLRLSVTNQRGKTGTIELAHDALVDLIFPLRSEQ